MIFVTIKTRACFINSTVSAVMFIIIIQLIQNFIITDEKILMTYSAGFIGRRVIPSNINIIVLSVFHLYLDPLMRTTVNDLTVNTHLTQQIRINSGIVFAKSLFLNHEVVV